MEDKRLTKRMLAYWNLIRRDHVYPPIQKLNSAAIDELWPKCFLVSINPKKRNHFQYEYMGQELISIYGCDLTGRPMERNPRQFPGVVVFSKLDDIVYSPRPMEDGGYFINEAGKLIKYRACFLPFGMEGKGLTHITVGLSYRVF